MKKSGKLLKTFLALTLVLLTVLTSSFGLIPALKAEAMADLTGKTFYYGSYPQTQVAQKLGKQLATLADPDGWISYGYMTGSGEGDYDGSATPSDYMVYQDVVYEGEKYRGVIFHEYRAEVSNRPSNKDADAVIRNNGYRIDKTFFWFKFEPIEWTIVNKKGLAISSLVLDAQPFNSTLRDGGDGEYYKDAEQTIYGNNYEESSIRQWLNNEFYNTAFSEEQKLEVMETKVSNVVGGESYAGATQRTTLTGFGETYIPVTVTIVAGVGDEKYNSNTTEDKVFLLSTADLLKSSNFPSGGLFTDDKTKGNKFLKAEASDYAFSQGEKAQEYADGKPSVKNGQWLLRTGTTSSRDSFVVDFNGSVYEAPTNSILGVRPVITVHMCEDGTFDILDYDADPTCTEKGAIGGKCCSKCGAVLDYGEAIAPLGHNPSEEKDIKGFVDATCTEEGHYYEYTWCTRCFRYLDCERVTIDPKGHTAGEPVKENIVPATCTAEGSYDEVVYCTECGIELSRTAKTIEKAAHDYEAAETEPTCTAQGYTTYTCKACGDSYVSDYTDPMGHIVPFALDRPATCTEKGYTPAGTCAVCGETLTEAVETPALGHQYELISTTEPTCTSKGVKTYKCVRCDATYTEEFGEATGHDGENGRCSTCGQIYGFRCGFCSKYEQGKDVPVIGWFISFIHMIIHGSQSIAPLS